MSTQTNLTFASIKFSICIDLWYVLQTFNIKAESLTCMKIASLNLVLSIRLLLQISGYNNMLSDKMSLKLYKNLKSKHNTFHLLNFPHLFLKFSSLSAIVSLEHMLKFQQLHQIQQGYSQHKQKRSKQRHATLGSWISKSMNSPKSPHPLCFAECLPFIHGENALGRERGGEISILSLLASEETLKSA